MKMEISVSSKIDYVPSVEKFYQVLGNASRTLLCGRIPGIPDTAMTAEFELPDQYDTKV